MPYRQLAEEILTRWRQAERELDARQDRSPEADRLRAEIAALRDQYQRVIDNARQAHAVEPPPFPMEP